MTDKQQMPEVNEFDYELRFDRSECGGTGCWSYFGIMTDIQTVSEILVRIDRKHDFDVAERKARELVKRWNAFNDIRVPDELNEGNDEDNLLLRVSSARILHGARAYYLPEDILALEEAARELQRIKELG